MTSLSAKKGYSYIHILGSWDNSGLVSADGS